MVIGLLVSVFLGRTLGAKGVGVINLANQIVNILIILALLGTPQLLIKEIAIAYQKKDWQHISNYMHSSLRLNGIIAVIISLVLVLVSPWLCEHIFHEPELKIPLIIASAVIAFQVCSRIFSSGLVGFRKIWQSNLVNENLSIFVAGLVLLVMWMLHLPINVIYAAMAYAIGRVVVTVSISIYWKTLNRHKVKPSSMKLSGIFKPAMPFFLISVTSVVASSVASIMIGWLGNARELGLYSVASRLALLTIFFLQVTNSAISPKLAALYAENKIKEMNKMVQSVTAGLLGVALIPFFIFVFAGHHLLSIWGGEFSAAYWILVVLSFGQVFNIGTGASGLILIMCGYEKIHAYISIGSIILNIILNFVLIRNYGALGSAIAMAISMGIENIVKVIIAKIKTSVMTIPQFPMNGR